MRQFTYETSRRKRLSFEVDGLTAEQLAFCEGLVRDKPDISTDDMAVEFNSRFGTDLTRNQLDYRLHVKSGFKRRTQKPETARALKMSVRENILRSGCRYERGGQICGTPTIGRYCEKHVKAFTEGVS